MDRNKRYLLIASFAVALVLVATACGTPAPPPAETAAPEETPAPPATATPTTAPAAPKVLRIATAAGCEALDFAQPGGPCTAMLAQMYESLIWRTDDAQLVPYLATSWEWLDDTTLQFKLREGVKFHNGEDFTAEAVDFSFDVALDPDHVWVGARQMGLLESVEVVDDYTVNLHTSAPFPDLPFWMGEFFIIPPQYTEEVGYEGLVDSPVGTGPFKFVDFVHGDYFKVEAFDDYWGGRSNIDEVLWRLIPESATRLAALQAGEIDIMAQVAVDLIPVVEEDPDLNMAYANELMTLQIRFDTLTDSPCADKAVRQAIDYAIDKETIWSELMGGLGRLSGQMLNPEVFGYNPDIEQTPYDPARARELLEEAGYADGLTLELYTIVGKYLVDRDGAIAVADQLADVGIDVNVNVVEPATFLDIVKEPTARFDMYWTGSYSYGNAAQAMQWFSETQPWHKWSSDEYTRLYTQVLSTVDDEEREALYHQMAEIVKEEAPAVFLMQQVMPYGVSNKVVNWEPHSMQYIYLVDADLQE